ncbi:endoplasmic reticulum aminopeptidase 2-like isoform X2 [Nylanderia fulva]|nr:endoplasmic reticulum aminopeptidase 2-like isoform X2 [Nylanderia fulva]XP_029173559.1 endoplasmic reticulum aminopeptidase 2-like isoform X2 [Nylanderia fulva]
MKELSPGNYTLNIKYFGIADKGFRIFDTKEKITWVGAPHFQIISARQVFPCWHSHNLLLEATFNISLGCHNCTTLSNMPLRNTERDEYNLVWKHYDITPVMLTHHATMVMSNYHLFHLDNKTQNIQMWCRNESGFHIDFAKNIAENITLLFKNKWQLSNKIPYVTHVAIPNFHDDGTIFEFVFYKETDIIFDKNVYPIAHTIEVAQLVGRKVIQQWFNDMMNNPLVSDFWFKKGFITWLATHAVNEFYPDYQITNLFVVQNQHYSFNLDGDYYMWNFTSQVNSSLKIPNSIRAPFILRMMYHVTEKIFPKAIRIFVCVYKNPLHRLDFVKFMRDIASDVNQDIVSQLTKMENWASEIHCPLIKLERNYDNPESLAILSIQNIDTLKIRCIPVTFTTQTFPDFNNFTHYLLCQEWDKSLPIPFTLSLPYKEYGWMIFNIQQIGYYRVNYDNENWKRISTYLNSDDYTKIHVLNRAQIIDDAFHLMIAGKLQSHIFWDIIMYLHREKDYIAWYPMFKALEYIFSTFPVLEEKNKNVATLVREILHNVLELIKYEEIDDIDELKTICLRQEAAKWACFLGDINCKKTVNNKLKQHLQDPTNYKLFPWWKEWTYCKGLMTTIDETTWQLVYTKGLKKSDTKFLEYLACPEDINLIKNYLTFKQTISPKENYPNSFNSFLHIITKHAKNSAILQHILYNFNEIRPKNVSITAALIIIINNVYSVNQTQEINNYVESMKIKSDLFVRMNYTENFVKSYHIEMNFIKRISDKIESRISIRNKQIKRQKEYFDRFFY